MKKSKDSDGLKDDFEDLITDLVDDSDEPEPDQEELDAAAERLRQAESAKLDVTAKPAAQSQTALTPEATKADTAALTADATKTVTPAAPTPEATTAATPAPTDENKSAPGITSVAPPASAAATDTTKTVPAATDTAKTVPATIEPLKSESDTSLRKLLPLPSSKQPGVEPDTPANSRRESMISGAGSAHSIDTSSGRRHLPTTPKDYSGATLSQVAFLLNQHLEATKPEEDEFARSLWNPCCCLGMKIEAGAKAFIKYDIMNSIAVAFGIWTWYYFDMRVQFTPPVITAITLGYLTFFVDVYLLYGPVHVRFTCVIWLMISITFRYMILPVMDVILYQGIWPEPWMATIQIGLLVGWSVYSIWALMVFGTYSRILWKYRKEYLKTKGEEDYKASRNNPLVRVESIQVPGPSVRDWKPTNRRGKPSLKPSRSILKSMSSRVVARRESQESRLGYKHR